MPSPTTFIKLTPRFVLPKLMCPLSGSKITVDESHTRGKSAVATYPIRWIKKRHTEEPEMIEQHSEKDLPANKTEHTDAARQLFLSDETRLAEDTESAHQSSDQEAHALHRDDSATSQIEALLKEIHGPNHSTQEQPASAIQQRRQDAYKVMHRIHESEMADTHRTNPKGSLAQLESRLRILHLEQQMVRHSAYRGNTSVMIPIYDLRPLSAQPRINENEAQQEEKQSSVKSLSTSQPIEHQIGAGPQAGGLRRMKKRGQHTSIYEQSDEDP